MADRQRSFGAVARTMIAVLVLAGLAGSCWLYRCDYLPLSGTRAGVAGHAIDRRPDGPLPVADPPGVTSYHSDVRRFSEIRAMHTLTPDEHSAYNAGGATTTRVSVGKLNGANVAVIEVQLSDQAAAAATMDRLVSLQRGYGLTKTVPTPPGVVAGEEPHPTADGDWLIRGHYVHGDVLVRITSRGDRHPVVLDGFHDAVTAQLRILHADV